MKDFTCVAQNNGSGRSGATLPAIPGNDRLHSIAGQVFLDAVKMLVRNAETSRYVFKGTATGGDVREIQNHSNDVEVLTILVPQARTCVDAVHHRVAQNRPVISNWQLQVTPN